jgi:hypothetical protein
MSIESWKAEFYPVPAEDCPQNDKDMLAHAKLKWSGLVPETLEKHRLSVFAYWLKDSEDERFHVGDTTCSLCFRYMEYDECAGCPLCAVNGLPCDRCFNNVSPWGKWCDEHNPNPMIDLIDQAIASLKP